MLIVFSMIFFVVACKDELNIPDYGGIEDTETPTISIISPIKDSTYLGLTEIPIKIDFMDDYQLSEIQVQLIQNNFIDTGLSFILSMTDSNYSLDTFYNIPSTDSISYDVVIIASDLDDNIVTESYNFATKD